MSPFESASSSPSSTSSITLPEMTYLTPAQSSAIAAWGWDPLKKELFLTFSGGDTYAFKTDSETILNMFKDAPSKGRFYNQELKAKFPTRKVLSTPHSTREELRGMLAKYQKGE